MSELQRDLTRISHNTKIVATLGPGSNNVQLLEDMIRVGGLNVVRFNFSHGTPESMKKMPASCAKLRNAQVRKWLFLLTCKGLKSVSVKLPAAASS